MVSQRQHEPGAGIAADPESAAVVSFVRGDCGRIETISVSAAVPDPDLPTLWFLVGWWGGAGDYLPAMEFFAGAGFNCRTFSWRGTGRSQGHSFWGRGCESDLLRVLDHFDDRRVVLIVHSGAADCLRAALPRLRRHAQAIRAAIVIAPLARSGSMNALLTWLKPDGSGTNLIRWIRFLGSNLLGVAWFMRNELALRRVLLADHVDSGVVRQVWRQIDACPYGRYFLSLWRFPRFLQPPETPLASYGLGPALLLHCGHDRNFTPRQQRATAQAFAAEFEVLPGSCHQWFADPPSFRAATARILSWLAEKRVIPKDRAIL